MSTSAGQGGPRPLAILAGAGFSKVWGLPLASEVMAPATLDGFPGRWQRYLLATVYGIWQKTRRLHHGVVDEFARYLQAAGPLTLVQDTMTTTHVVESSGAKRAISYRPRRTTGTLSLSFEQFATFLALRLSSAHWHRGASRATSWAVGDHVRRQAYLPPCYKELVDGLKGQVMVGIVTTNYDLVFEKLLGPSNRGRLGGINYGKIGERLIGRHSMSSRWSYGPVAVNGKIPLMKLHGSLNWGVDKGGRVIKYVDARPSRGRRYVPLIVPPAGSIQQQRLGDTWRGAFEVLSSAKLWLICGYSFPPYDIAVGQMLRSALPGVERIVIMDVNPSAVQGRLRNLAPSTANIVYGPPLSDGLTAGEIRRLLDG